MLRISSLLLSFVLVQTLVYGQTETRTSILKDAAQKHAEKEARDRSEMLKVAEKKGWPLMIQGKSGQFALLTAIDEKGYPMYTATDYNTRAAATIGTNKLWTGGSTGLNLNGADNSVKGKLGVWDGGKIYPTHVEFNNRVLTKDNVSTISDHSTHVAGTLIAAGVYPPAKGMANGMQQLIAYDYNGHISEMLTESANLLVSNHSYGSIAGWRFNDVDNRWEFWGQFGQSEDYKFGYYSSETQLWDSIAYNAPYYLIVKSSGNNRNQNGPAVGAAYWRYDANGNMTNAGNRPAGISDNNAYDIIPTYGTAKNILTVGAVYPIETGYSRPADVVMSSFSSWGPTDDGRIKPDVVANGVSVVSTVSNSDNAYASLSGTSMSSPNAAGSVLLLQEYYARLNGGAFMRSATLKGLVIHTANEAGTSDGPDYSNGWGLINMEGAANVIKSKNTKQFIYEKSLANSGSFSLPVVASGEGKLTVTISWTDPKSTVDPTNTLNNPAPKLVNDLDVRVKKGATVYMPWILNPASPSSPATKGDNIRDNVEKIEISDVVPGATYTIEVSHKGTLERGSQAYSLIVTGAGGAAYCSSAPSSTAGARIDSVSIGGVTKQSPAGCTGYVDNTSLTATVESNSVTPLFIKLNSCDATANNKIVKAFIDFNNDGDFLDAGELVATSGSISGTGTFSGNITIPAGVAVGNFSILRIVAQETSTATDVNSCGAYSNGETQDYRIQFTAPSKDMGLVSIVNPSSGDCANGEQYVTIQIKNFGKTAQSNVPLTAVIKSGTTTVATLTATYPGTIAEYATANYTFQTPFASSKGTTYTITLSTGLTGDQNATNDQLVETVAISTTPAGPASAVAELCGTTQVILKVNNPSSYNLYNWYDSPTATTPVARGALAATNTLPANKTLYVSTNEMVSNKVGPANKAVYTDGGYNSFSGNFVKFTNSVPVILESVKLYTRFAGKINFIVADIVNFDQTTGSYSYIPLATTTLDVASSHPTPAAGSQTGNDAVDQGAIYQLNLPVSTAGDHAIIVQCQNGATLFRNANIAANPYPFSIPGVISITGNSAVSASDAVLYQKYYYFFYDMQVSLVDCPSARTAVVASTATVPVITANGKTLTSTAAVAYQWYQNGNPMNSENNQTFTATTSGTYKVVTTDALGCQQVSNEITLTISATIDLVGDAIKLKVNPIPNRGQFNLDFEMKKKGNMDISLVNETGQLVYAKSYPGFIGRFTDQLNVPGANSGVYLLKIQQGDVIYLKKVIVQR